MLICPYSQCPRRKGGKPPSICTDGTILVCAGQKALDDFPPNWLFVTTFVFAMVLVGTFAALLAMEK